MIRLLSLFILLALSSGCTLNETPASHWMDTKSSMQWPGTPERARIRYLGEFKGDEFEKTSTTKKFLTWLTGSHSQKLPFISPYGIVADGQGKIWVADMGIHGVHQIDLARKKVSYILSAGTIPLVTPSGLAIDLERQRLYVSDSTSAKVFQFDLEGRFIKEWNCPPDNFGRPAGLAVDRSGRLYVVDAKKNRLSVFSQEGIFDKNIYSTVLPDLSFNTPSNVAISKQGQVFVVDSLNFRIEHFSENGESLGTIGSIGDGPGYFARPRGIALDTDDNIYVSDATFDNIQVFDTSGNLMIYFGQSGKKTGEFSLPAGITIDQYNRIYIVDSFNRRLQFFQYLP